MRVKEFENGDWPLVSVERCDIEGATLAHYQQPGGPARAMVVYDFIDESLEDE